ncbi:MAG: PDZ domain-containing protein, partial [Oscillospiraceae bacterium]|nr:PDZ domain-containing protein [Oscillospiraceae bacterium]
MNKKVSLGLTLSLIFISVALAITITMTVSMLTYNGLIKDVSGRSGMYSGLSEIDDAIRENYYGEINENLLNSMISKGYIDGLGDRYSAYMNADEYAQYKQLEKGTKGGIGIVAVFDEISGGIYISEIADSSPAKLQGMNKGDIITEIDGTKVTALNALSLMQKLEGDKLTEVTITFVHNKEAKTVKVARGYTMQTVYYRVMDEKVGYIKITEFYRNTAEELQNALKFMSDKGVSSVIFDVRNNADGFVPYATACLDLIVPVATEGTGALATAVDKNGNTIETFTSDSDSISMSMCV